ncbi:MAG: hypothetical protein ACRD6X_20425, partial [Pyrinomonadaceae bacterium]
RPRVPVVSLRVANLLSLLALLQARMPAFQSKALAGTDACVPVKSACRHGCLRSSQKRLQARMPAIQSKAHAGIVACKCKSPFGGFAI